MKKTYTITYTLNGNVAIHSITSEDGTKPTRAEATRALSFFLNRTAGELAVLSIK